MLDLILGWAVIFFPTALAVAFIFIPARSENESAHMKWRYCLVIFGVIFSLLAWLQQSRALKAAEQELSLNYVPSVDLLWQNKEFDIISHGKTNLYLWGDKLDDGPKSIDKPRLITPTGSYHLYGEQVEKEILSKIGNNQESRVPFELYVSGEDRRKHILKYQLWIRVKDGMVKIDTQNLGTVDADF